jgi:acetyl-CoA acyltransferase
MNEVVIIDAVRAPSGKFRGALSSVRAGHLGAVVPKALSQRCSVTPEVIDDVIFGCVTQVGEQSGNIARTAAPSAGWPITVPGMTVDRKCGSSESAVQIAAGLIALGTHDAVIAGGAENMRRVPMGGSRDVHGEPFGWNLKERFELTSQGEAAERVSDKWQLNRDQLDDFAIESHRSAVAAADGGFFDREITEVLTSTWSEKESTNNSMVTRDETILRDTSRERLATLKTSFRQERGRITAGNASQISDGAAALILMSRRRAEELKLRPGARIIATTIVGSDPALMLTGPIPATHRVLDRAGLTPDDIDLFEVNEAFAPVPMAWMKEVGVSRDRQNVNGGAIALGHPLGASGARIMTTLLHELERRQGRYGLQSICCAGGMARATLIERLS